MTLAQDPVRCGDAADRYRSVSSPRLDEWVKETVRRAPPLTADQIETLRRLLAPPIVERTAP